MWLLLVVRDSSEPSTASSEPSKCCRRLVALVVVLSTARRWLAVLAVDTRIDGVLQSMLGLLL
jgi:hypothetical protein